MEQFALKEVQSAIKEFNSYPACGPDRISTLLIKNVGDYLHNTITNILNATCQLGCFPDTWKPGIDTYHNPNLYRFCYFG